jgi:type IV secretory pathway VirB3-like protein
MMFESIFESITAETSFTLDGLLLSVGSALPLGLMISLVYRMTHRTKTPSQSFSVILVVLTAIITLIILLVGNSVARAFSLAGAFQLIRFRSAPTDSRDISYVLFSVAVGLCCGMGYILYAVVAAVLLCCVMVILHIVGYGKSRADSRLLRITIPENLNYENVFDDLFARFCKSSKLVKVKTTALGSLYQLQYAIVMDEKKSEKEMLDEIRCRNGNLEINVTTDVAQNEF